MSDHETIKITKDDIIDMKMRDIFLRKDHLNNEKKENKMKTRNNWKKKYCKRGRNGHKREDKK